MAPPGYQEGAGGAGLNHANGCFQHTYSPGSFAGQTVTLKFTGTGPGPVQRLALRGGPACLG